jgi:hypothetical protein
MAEEKKSATIFDFIEGVTSKKKPWNKWNETDQKAFSPYIVNRWLSMRQDLVEVINELQTYTIGLLRPQETYRLYHELLPHNKAFAKYIKGKKEDKFSDKLISQVAEHYKVSRSEATDYVYLMDQTSCTRLLNLYGYTEKEVKSMLKGVRK